MLPPLNHQQLVSRREFFQHSGLGISSLALLGLLQAESGQAIEPHFKPRAKRVIYLHMIGAPSQLDLFDHKPQLAERQGEELPESIRRGQVLTTMTADQPTKPIVASPFRFARHGQCGAMVSELLPQTASIVDDLCFVRSMFTEAINHDPAITLLQTGSQQPGRPSMGAWLSYGLGSANDNLPTFTVMISGGEPLDQPLNGRLWGAGFLPTSHQAVRLRGGSEPISYLDNPPGISRAMRRRMHDTYGQLQQLDAQAQGDPAIDTRTEQFELAFRMQRAVPELLSTDDETEKSLARYGPDVTRPGTFAANCLLARRMAERGVRFIQLYHRGWDHHLNLPTKLPSKCRQVDQPSAALVRDLKDRGLLDDTLVIWAGEFGRTVYCQGHLERQDFGRDHHPRCFTIWLAGGGVRSGATVGRTDDYSYNIEEEPIHVHDLQATVLHLLGLDHTRLTYRHQGRDFRLTDIGGRVVPKLLM